MILMTNLLLKRLMKQQLDISLVANPKVVRKLPGGRNIFTRQPDRNRQ